MIRTRDEILRTLADHANDIRGLGGKRRGLFGSAARGAMTAKSDLNFLVEFEQKSFDAYMGLKLYLEDLFQTHVDLVLPGSIKPGLEEAILAEAVDAGIG
jgi:predicted nucleotidyltransferase